MAKASMRMAGPDRQKAEEVKGGTERNEEDQDLPDRSPLWPLHAVAAFLHVRNLLVDFSRTRRARVRLIL